MKEASRILTNVHNYTRYLHKIEIQICESVTVDIPNSSRSSTLASNFW